MALLLLLLSCLGMLFYNWESQSEPIVLPPTADEFIHPNTKLANQLMNIRESLVDDLPEETQAVLHLTRF